MCGKVAQICDSHYTVVKGAEGLLVVSEGRTNLLNLRGDKHTGTAYKGTHSRTNMFPSLPLDIAPFHLKYFYIKAKLLLSYIYTTMGFGLELHSWEDLNYANVEDQKLVKIYVSSSDDSVRQSSNKSLDEGRPL